MNALFELYVNFVQSQNVQTNALKRVKLFNAFCLVWYCIAIIRIVMELFHYGITTIVIGHCCFALLIMLAQFLHYRGKYVLGYVIFIACLFATVYIFSNLIATGNLNEFYYLLIPSIALVFFDDNRINLVLLFLSGLGLILPNYIFNYYDDAIGFNSIIKPILLVSLYFIIFYFKRLNAKNETKLKERNIQLQQLNKAVTSMYTNLMHEFFTPITVIKGLNSKSDSDKVTQSKIDHNANQLLELVDQMMALSKLESGHLNFEPALVDLIPFVEYITRASEPAAELKNISLSFTTEIDSLTMDVDSKKLKLVINNLLSNAIKYSNRGGKVKLEIAMMDNNQVSILVSDKGIGILEQELDLIFNRFYQVDKSSHAGAGIGLSLVKNMTELMLGKIYVESVQDQGSCFKIVLPITRHSNEAYNFNQKLEWVAGFQNKSQDHQCNKIEEEKAKILLIEDNEDIVFYLKKILNSGYNISYASDGEKGLTQAKNEIPDIIITDIMMPKIDGLDLTQRLKEDKSTNHIPIIMLTAKTTMQDRVQGLKVGADAYLTKPFNEQELILIIRNILNKRKKLQRYFAINQDYPKDESIQKGFMEEVKEIILKNLGNENFGIQDICEKVHLERSQLYRKVKAISGNSPSDHIKHMRLKHGDALLRRGNLTIREVAFACGFKDPSYFSKRYKDKYGRLPKSVIGLKKHLMR